MRRLWLGWSVYGRYLVFPQPLRFEHDRFRSAVDARLITRERSLPRARGFLRVLQRELVLKPPAPLYGGFRLGGADMWVLREGLHRYVECSADAGSIAGLTLIAARPLKAAAQRARSQDLQHRRTE